MNKKTKVIFVSNYMNHHQIEFCDEMSKSDSVDFYFVSLEELPEEKIAIGYDDFQTRKYIVPFYKNENKKQNFAKICDADVVICSPSNESIQFCSFAKQIFIFSEHIFKSSPLLHPKNIFRFFKYRIISQKFKKLDIETYILCASSRTKKELSFCGFKWVKGFIKWGYFPKNGEVENRDKDSSVCNLLWVNRMVSWKHPQKGLKILKIALKQNLNAHLTFIGDGPKKNSTIAKTKKMNLFDRCTFCGYLPNKQVLEKMTASHYIISTSDRGEGWGATINEGMKFGCVPIVSNQIGCAKFLVTDSVGIVYRKIDKILFPTFVEWKSMSSMAISRISTKWNGVVACRNLLKIIEDNTLLSEIENNDMPGTLIEDNEK